MDISHKFGRDNNQLSPSAFYETATQYLNSGTLTDRVSEMGRSSSLVFIDTTVDDYQSLMTGMRPDMEVHILNPVEDAISQITQTLTGRSGIESLHIFSHADSGTLDFALNDLNLGNLDGANTQFELWRQAFTPDADILLYGCNVASGELGKEFVLDMSKLTGADVAASTDFTGSAIKGGNWALEYSTGQIESVSAIQGDRQEAYKNLLTGSTANVNPTRIMPLGDSITQGAGKQNSYRRLLWFDLVNAGYKVDFVGSINWNIEGYPPSKDFDLDHEGHGGWRADQVLSNIDGWAASARPDVVLLHVGTNDATAGESAESTIEDVRGIIQKLRNQNPNVKVLLSQIIPIINSDRAQKFNMLVPNLASQMSTSQSPVIVVDQYSGFDVNSDTLDGYHPNDTGEWKMANRWFNALKQVL